MPPPNDAIPGPANLSISVASGDALDVREFAVEERMSSLFTVRIVAVSESPNLDFEAIAGHPARFRLWSGSHGGAAAGATSRSWTGLCSHLQQIAAEESGLSTYELTVVPTLWLLTQRRNYRLFQHTSEPDIVLQILGEWGIQPALRLGGAYKKREYRVQYGESDYAFVCRMLEDAGISFFFDEEDGATRLVLSDAPEWGEERAPGIPFREGATALRAGEHVCRVRVGRQVRPGRCTLRDHDYRRPPAFPLSGSAAGPGGGVEERLEQFDYRPGAFVFGVDKGDDAPISDARGKVGPDEGEAATLAQKRLDAERGSARAVAFETTAHDLAPGVVMRVVDHPRGDVDGKRLLIVESALGGRSYGEWTHRCEARTADAPHRPPLVTPKPKVSGVESATVVGPAGEEIHCDEYGRVRVHFHWDRYHGLDESSSCWIHVSHPWGGAGFGGINLPRVGQEVIVDFLGGDPDQPVIIGRVFTHLQRVPYKLPDNKTQSGWKSSSTGGGGGYNEILFEDAAGRELLRVQAERDYAKLVKRDETKVVRRDKSNVVQRDEESTVGNNRKRTVKGIETITIEKDRRKSVLGDEDIAIAKDRRKRVQGSEIVAIEQDRAKEVSGSEDIVIGKNRSKRVKGAEEVIIEQDRTKSIEGGETVTIAKDRKKTVRGDEVITNLQSRVKTVLGGETVTIALNRMKTVQGSEQVTIAKDRTKSVAGNENISIAKSLSRMVSQNARDVTGLNQSVVVGMNRSTQVGLVDATVVGGTYSVMVSPPGEGEAGSTCNVIEHDFIKLETPGGASIVLQGDKITMSAPKIEVLAHAEALIHCEDKDKGKDGKLHIECKKGPLSIRGGPLVKINTD